MFTACDYENAPHSHDKLPPKRRDCPTTDSLNVDGYPYPGASPCRVRARPRTPGTMVPGTRCLCKWSSVTREFRFAGRASFSNAALHPSTSGVTQTQVWLTNTQRDMQCDWPTTANFGANLSHGLATTCTGKRQDMTSSDFLKTHNGVC